VIYLIVGGVLLCDAKGAEICGNVCKGDLSGCWCDLCISVWFVSYIDKACTHCK
jgi:hypothetical protein